MNVKGFFFSTSAFAFFSEWVGGLEVEKFGGFSLLPATPRFPFSSTTRTREAREEKPLKLKKKTKLLKHSRVSSARTAGSGCTTTIARSGCLSGLTPRSRTVLASSMALCIASTPLRTASSPSRSSAAGGKGAQWTEAG